jgi:hypothetical protein
MKTIKSNQSMTNQSINTQPMTTTQVQSETGALAPSNIIQVKVWGQEIVVQKKGSTPELDRVLGSLVSGNLLVKLTAENAMAFQTKEGKELPLALELLTGKEVVVPVIKGTTVSFFLPKDVVETLNEVLADSPVKSLVLDINIDSSPKSVLTATPWRNINGENRTYSLFSVNLGVVTPEKLDWDIFDSNKEYAPILVPQSILKENPEAFLFMVEAIKDNNEWAGLARLKKQSSVSVPLPSSASINSSVSVTDEQEIPLF